MRAQERKLVESLRCRLKGQGGWGEMFVKKCVRKRGTDADGCEK